MNEPIGGYVSDEKLIAKEYTSCHFTDSQKRYFVWKRILDVVISVLMLIVLSPVMILVALIIKFSAPTAPIFFRQYRIGLHYHVFKIYKFRTMHTSAPKNTATGELENADKMITRIGKFLRKSSLDELPQLFNVIKGDMSLIGPRPLVYTERQIRALRKKYFIYSMRPGITGIAQINGRDKVSMIEKVRMDAEYVHYAGLRLDFEIFIRTIVAVLFHKGIVEGRQSKK